jgi:hypothetical protein
MGIPMLERDFGRPKYSSSMGCELKYYMYINLEVLDLVLEP